MLYIIVLLFLPLHCTVLSPVSSLGADVITGGPKKSKNLDKIDFFSQMIKKRGKQITPLK